MEPQSTGNVRNPKAKVKSGCRTCKIRKVKCDEARPVCRRCITSGRMCDGYGVWGGGETFHGHLQRVSGTKAVVPISSIQVLPLVSGDDEKKSFEWFKCRTVPKIPGSFQSSFWTRLLFQASINEPAVLHAVLTLSSVHKGGIIAKGKAISNFPSHTEQFTLQHYVKAISHLQPHFSNKDRASFRIALITCVVFVCMEFLRGHFETGQIHLLNGIKILGEMQIISVEDGIMKLKRCPDPTDDWIVEQLCRLHLQVELFRYTYQHPCIVLQPPGFEKQTVYINSIYDSWKQYERVLNKIFHLTHQARLGNLPRSELLDSQTRIKIELAQWLEVYESYTKSRFEVTQRSVDLRKVYQVQSAYHTMATIMAETCISPNDEMLYDTQTATFEALLAQMHGLHDISSSSPRGEKPELLTDMSGSIIDMGWMPPLYYVAVKCRHHWIRMQAVKLLETTTHREGMWDSRITALVARKVVEIEESSFFKNVQKLDELPAPRVPTSIEMNLPILPDSYRLLEVEVILSGSPLNKIQLYCKQEHRGRVLLSEYNMKLRQWEDLFNGCSTDVSSDNSQPMTHESSPVSAQLNSSLSGFEIIPETI